jgi:YVTN family beta-propeller protein
MRLLRTRSTGSTLSSHPRIDQESAANAQRAAPRRLFALIAFVIASLWVASASAQVQPPNPPPSFPPQVGGEWGPVLVFPHVPVSIANLPDGRVLTFSSNEPNSFPGSQNDEYTHASVWDPVTGNIKDVPHPNHDMFCAALVMLESGEPLVMGGRNQGDSPWTSYFDFRTDEWIQIEDMNRGRWYPTAVYLGTGEVFIAAGVGGGVNPEIWSPDTGWKLLTGIDLSSTILQFGTRDGSGSWPLLQLTKDGTVFHHGANDRMNDIDPFGGAGSLGTIQDLGPHNRNWYPDEGVSVLYDEGRILVAGGSTSTSNNTSVRSAFTIDITETQQPGPVLAATGNMVYPRQFQNEVVLPTGDVLVVGGNTSGLKFTDEFAIKNAEAWDPITGQWTLWNAQDQARTYHSTAVLLTDGRVFSAGGGLDGDSCANPEGPGECQDDHWNAEVFSPPYLFDSNGQPALRPEIENAPDVVRVGRTFDVKATPGLTGFSMVRMSANTHTMNTDQRLLRPSVTETSPGNYSLTVHSNLHVLVPGYWMLFGLEGDTPSVSHVIQVVKDGTPRGEHVAPQRNDTGETVLLQIVAEDPDGNALSYSAAGLPDGLTISPLTGTIQGTLGTAGVFNVAVTAFDGSEAGEISFSWAVSSSRSEVGTVSRSQVSRGQWHAVPFAHAYTDPIVVTGAPSTNDGAPTTLRVRNVTSTGFEFQIQEWDYLDGVHGTEDVSYLVVEAGEYLLPGGGSLVAGRTPGIDNENPFDQVFTPGAFVQSPLVLVQVATDNGNRAVTPRLQDVDTSGFNVRIQGEEALSQNLPFEDLHWVAMESASIPGVLEADITPNSVDEVPENVSFGQSFSGLPHLLSTAQTRNGGDVVALRYDNLSAVDVDFVIEEEQSADSETAHSNEVVGWIAIDPGAGDLGLLPLFNQSPDVIDPGPQTGEQGDAVSLFIQATDADSDPLAFAASGLPDGLSLDPDTGEIFGSLDAAGIFSVTVAATDPSNASGATNFLWTVTEVLTLTPFAAPPRLPGETIDYTATTNLPGNLSFEWDFGDGSPLEGPFASPDISHAFGAPGRHIVTITVTDLDTLETDQHQFVQNVTAPATAQPPTSSTSILYEAGANRVWAVSPDNDRVSVVETATNTRTAEIPVCGDPRTLAIAGDGRVWVACKDDAVIDVIDPSLLSVVQTYQLPFGSQPHGLVFDPVGNTAFVALEAAGRILKLDGTTGVQLGSRDVGRHVRHLAVSGDGLTLQATRFVTQLLPNEASGVPDTEIAGQPVGGEVLSLDTATLTPGPTSILRASVLPDTAQSARGIPNYLGAPVISPDGSELLVPSKQDNVMRGDLREGIELTHDTTVRAITSRVDLATGQENPLERVDHDNASLASAVIYSQKGAYALAALEGNREISVFEPYSHFELGRVEAGRAPHGMALSPDGRTLYVDDFMDRTISVYSLANLLDYDDPALPELAVVSKVSSEALAADVLIGKQIFYDAADTRVSLESYMACASCHNDGGQDGRVWDFGQFSEGFRNTIGLQGRGQGHGPVHWTANFDEIHDFEIQIRNFGGGSGLMSDPDFAATADPFGAPKAGLSADLDALAAYVGSLTTAGDSPHRQSDGSLTPEAVTGKQVFMDAGCGNCHVGAAFTDSMFGVKHDVGTSKPISGPHTAFDTPTLRGLWMTDPYLHDGSAATLADAIAAHTAVSVDAGDVAPLVAYLEQIDDAELVAPSLIAADLIGAWGFEELSGITAVDTSGHGLDGVIENGATRSANGFFGRGVEINGSAGNVNLGGIDAHTDGLTIMAWMNANDFGTKDARIVSKSTGSAEQDHVWMLSTINGPRLRFRLKTEGSTSTLVDSGPTLPTGTWVHAAVTYDGSTMRIFQDGIEIGSRAKSGFIDQAPGIDAWIGANPGQPSQVFDGRIDEVKIYRRALDASEIQVEMASPSLPFEDTDPPGTPSFLNANAVASDAVELVWGAASDNVGVTGYRVYRDGGLVTTTSASTFVDGTLSSGIEYSYEVTAFDAEDNEGPAAGPVLVTTPTPDVTSPNEPGAVTATAVSASLVSIGWTEATDDVAVVEYKVYRDGAEIASLPAAARSYDDTSVSPETTYLYEVTALDFTGNESDPTPTGQSVQTPAPPSGLVGLWGFDEAAGATALDSSGQGNDGTFENGAVRAASGFFGKSAETNGSAGNVNLGGLDVAGDQITIMGWVNADDFGTSDARIVSKSTGSGEQDHIWMISTYSGQRLRFRLSTNGTTHTLIGDGGSLTAGAWTHATASYDGATMRLYLNGAEVGSRAKSGNIDVDPAVNAWVGGNPGSNNQVFDGRIDELKIFSRALTPAEISAEMATPIVDPNDTTAPSAPSFLVATPIGSDAVKLDWGAATDNIGVTGYRIYRDGAEIATTGGLTFTDTPLASARTFAYAVTAYDGRDNEGAAAGPVDATTPAPDTSPPGEPGSVNAAVNGPTSVSVSWTASSDNVAVVEYKVYRDGAEIASLPEAARSYDDNGATPNTTHAYEVSALDLAGNESDPTATTQQVTTPEGPADIIGAWGFEEPSGPTALDASGNGNDGSIENGGVRTPNGHTGNGLEVNGSAGNVGLGGLDVDAGATGITIMAWINADDFGTKDARIVSKSTGSAEQDHIWMLSTIKGPRLRFRLKTGGNTTTLVASGPTIPEDAWVHVAASYDGTTMTLYQDGNWVGSTGKTGLVDIAPGVDAWIGANPGQSNQVFDGRIDDVKVFRRGLDATEIQAEMASSVGTP